MITKQKKEAVVNVESNYLCDVNSNNFIIGNTKFTTIVDNENELWIFGTQIARYFEYVNAPKAVQTHISQNNKKSFENLSHTFVGGLDKTRKDMQNKTIFINMNGVYELALKSKKAEAEKLCAIYDIDNMCIPLLFSSDSDTDEE